MNRLNLPIDLLQDWRIGALLDMPDGHALIGKYFLLSFVVGRAVRGAYVRDETGELVPKSTTSVAFSVPQWARHLCMPPDDIEPTFTVLEQWQLIRTTRSDMPPHIAVEVLDLSKYADEWTRRIASGANEKRRLRRRRKKGNGSGATTEPATSGSIPRKKDPSSLREEGRKTRLARSGGAVHRSGSPAPLGAAAAAVPGARLIDPKGVIDARVRKISRRR